MLFGLWVFAPCDREASTGKNIGAHDDDKDADYKKNDRFYLEGIFNKKLEILPLSENQFMSPSVYFVQIEFSKEENQAMIMKIILNDGRVRSVIRTVDPALASHN